VEGAESKEEVVAVKAELQTVVEDAVEETTIPDRIR
jgi:hypothetical protein